MLKMGPVPLMVLAVVVLGAGPCSRGSADYQLVSPAPGELIAAGTVEVVLALPRDGVVLLPAAVRFVVDGVEREPSAVLLRPEAAPQEQVFQFDGLAEGWHRVQVSVQRESGRVRVQRRGRRWDAKRGIAREHLDDSDASGRRRGSASVAFEMVTLQDPERCEFLNDIECLLPYPSSRFLRPDASTRTGYRVDLPAEGMPAVVVGSLGNFLNGGRSLLDPAPYNRSDGFSPMAHVLMHFPQGVDLIQSKVARLDSPDGLFDDRSKRRRHPTVLLEVETGRRVPHFIENDSRGASGRVTTVLRPAESLLPGHTYIVAVRRLRGADGAMLEAEPAFAALRDQRPTSIAPVEARREEMESLFRTLRRHRVKRRDLILAFGFRTQSDADLTGEMVSMRDQAFEILAERPLGEGINVSFALTVTPAAACEPGLVWRALLGTFEVPNFLAEDPGAEVIVPADPVGRPGRPGFLVRDDAGRPKQVGTYNAQWGLSVPCEALLSGAVPGIVAGHGLFGNGAELVWEFATELPPYIAQLKALGLLPEGANVDFALVGTQWSGLSSSDLVSPPSGVDFGNLQIADLAELLGFAGSFVGKLFLDLDRFPALPDRLRQGQVANLVLARHLESGAFNALPFLKAPAGTAIPEGEGVLQVGDIRYFGASLGGVMGLAFSALYPDLHASNVDVPGANFGFLVQRAKPFSAFQGVLEVIEPDPMRQLLSLGLLSELWLRGEGGAFLHHITGQTLDPVPGSSPKDILMTVARYDQQVPTVGAQIAAATMRLKNLPGSVVTGLVGVPDAQRSVRSGHIVYDTGSYQVGTPSEVFIPPPTNRPAAQEDNRCDPHTTRFRIPASLAQLLAFFEDGARPIENFCAGACDAGEALELPEGLDVPCDPF